MEAMLHQARARVLERPFCLRPVADMANHEPVEDVHDAIADEETPERAATGQRFGNEV